MSSPDDRRPRRRRDDPESEADNEDRTEVSEPSGEDLMENMADDYKDADAMNSYEDEGLDEREVDDDNPEARMRAEAEMAQRDRREKRGRRGLDIAGESEEDGEGEESGEGFPERRRRRGEEAGTGADAGAELEEEEAFDISGYPATPATLREERVQREVKRRFYRFLKEHTSPSGEPLHDKIIDDMVTRNSPSLHISYLHLSTAQPTFGIWLADMPRQMLSLFDEVAKIVVQEKYADYNDIQSDIHVRITALPLEDKIRDLRASDLNKLVKVSGVVTKRTGVYPQLSVVAYQCMRDDCQAHQPPLAMSGMAQDIPVPGRCVECQSAGPFRINSTQTVYRNYQKLTLQESPGSVPAGRVPRYKEVVLLADLIDAARPGEEIEVTGVYTNQFDASINAKNGFPVFCTLIEANFIQKRADALANNVITEEDIKAIEELKTDPRVVQRIAHSIGPSIYGHSHVKMAVAMAMFGGREKNVGNKHRVRGDINVLLLGDPGTAKSQMLKYVEKTAPRCVYTTGKGASAVGLTAAVTKDPITGEWTLEGGALVLADRGVCCIDEFDKMTDQDRTSIHEAMEQQSISISKAGIVTTLQARCAVVAAANPIGGRYDPSKSFSENVQLTDPILTRFDCLCVLRDEVDPVADERLAAFVMKSHARSHPSAAEAKQAKEAEAANKAAEALKAGRSVMEEDVEGAATGGATSAAGGSASKAGGSASGSEDDGADDFTGLKPIDQTLLRKYILHARERVKPSLEGIDAEKIPRLYAELRREAEISSGVPIAVRHIESILRMSEAVARMRLAAYVSDSDLNLAIRTQLHSFISAQKLGVQRALRAQFSRYLTVDRNFNTLLMVQLRELTREWQMKQGVRAADRFAGLEGERVSIKVSDLQDKARRLGITDISEFLKSAEMAKAGFSYDEGGKAIVKTLGGEAVEE